MNSPPKEERIAPNTEGVPLQVGMFEGYPAVAVGYLTGYPPSSNFPQYPQNAQSTQNVSGGGTQNAPPALLPPGQPSEVPIDVVLTLPGSEEKEMIRGILAHFSPLGNLDLSRLLLELKNTGYQVDKCMISYYSQSEDMHVFAGVDPLPEGTFCADRSIMATGKINLRCRLPRTTAFPKPTTVKMENPGMLKGAEIPPMSLPRGIEYSNNSNTIQEPAAKEGKAAGRRTKERKIGYIIEKVSLWRKLYNGVADQNGNMQRYSLEEAANKVSISKKSLDDYLLQLRFGRKFGFNFNEHKDDKVGVLRAFVRKHKFQNKAEKASGGALKYEESKSCVCVIYIIYILYKLYIYRHRL